jgi:hypothetical protein
MLVNRAGKFYASFVFPLRGASASAGRLGRPCSFFLKGGKSKRKNRQADKGLKKRRIETT